MYEEDTTVDDMLAEWDEGRSIWSVEMGGLGPGYEQAIQMLGIEILREIKDMPFDSEDEDEKKKQWDAINKTADEVAHRLDETYGYSGAQVGAAKNIASIFMQHGMKKGLDKAPDDRHIQVSKNFPTP